MWEVSSVTCSCDLSKWDVSSVQDMSRMFSSAESFDNDISEWDVSSVIDMDDRSTCDLSMHVGRIKRQR